MVGPQHKLLLPWRDGRPIVWHAVSNALGLDVEEVIVVVQPDSLEMMLALADLPVRCVPNPRYREGMSTSLVAGIDALGDEVDAALVLLGDEPEVSPRIVEALLDAYVEERKPITAPLYGAETGPPVLFARAAFPLLLQLQGDTGARHLIAKYPDLATLVPFVEGDRPHDIDTPGDYITPR